MADVSALSQIGFIGLVGLVGYGEVGRILAEDLRARGGAVRTTWVNKPD